MKLSVALLLAGSSCSGAQQSMMASTSGPVERPEPSLPARPAPWDRITEAYFESCDVLEWGFGFEPEATLPDRGEVVERLGVLWRAAVALGGAASEIDHTDADPDARATDLEGARPLRIAILETFQRLGAELPPDAGADGQELPPPAGTDTDPSRALATAFDELSDLAYGLGNAALDLIGRDPTCDVLQLSAYRMIQQAISWARTDQAVAGPGAPPRAGESERLEDLERSMPVVRRVLGSLRHGEADTRGAFEALSRLPEESSLSSELVTIAWNVMDVCGWVPEEDDDSSGHLDAPRDDRPAPEAEVDPPAVPNLMLGR